MITHVERDERTLAVENAGYRWSYCALSFGLLGVVAYRAFVRGEASWDLLGLVLFGGGINAAYQAGYRVLSRRWILVTAVTVVLALLVALGVAFFRTSR